MIYLKNISKNFDNIKALNSIDIHIKKEDITLLVGGNGSGKSTLAKIISGEIKPSSGEIIVNGEINKFLTYKNSLKYGISEVYQDFSLDNYRNIYENIFMGQEITKSFGVLDTNKMIKKTYSLYEDINITPPKLQTKVKFLSGGQRQIVAILKVLQRNSKMIIFDEPTSSLGIKESEEVENIIKHLNKKGITILIISHNIDQIYSLADSIIELKTGNLLGQFSLEEYKKLKEVKYE